MQRYVYILFAVVLLCATPVQAKACYKAKEYEAEQGLRIHSELMVISLTCEKMNEWAGIYNNYKRFTLKNESLINGYEVKMMDYFERTGAQNPEKKLHALRTKLGNKISQMAISMSTKSFCKAYGQRVEDALKMDQVTVQRWAQQVWPNNPSSQPLCK